MDPLRIACIGAWGHLDGLLLELDSTPPSLAQVVALSPALPTEDFAEFRKFKSARSAPLIPDYHQVLRDLRPDIAVISTRLDKIAPIAIDAAHAGCHLICEKPLALTHASLHDLVQAVRKHKIHCIAMMGNRCHPVLAAARDAVAAGRIGKVILANTRKSYKWGNRPDWFGNRDLYGGTIGWIGIHALDFIHTATNLDFTQVAAMQSNAAHPERPDCEDNSVLALTLSNGGHATVTLDFLRPQAAATHGNDSLRLVGSAGIIEAEMWQNCCLLTTPDSPEQELSLPQPAPYYADFYHHLQRRIATPPPDMPKAFYLTHAALCARDAADQSRILPIPPFAV